MCCLRKTLKPAESEIINGTCLSLLVMNNFQGVMQYIKVKADVISGLFLVMLKGLCSG